MAPGGALDLTRPEIVHDLANPTAPRSMPGLVAEALHRRRAAGVAPFTVVSCDNLPANGKAVARVVGELAERRETSLADWIRATVAFPSSMVDRMVPATTDDDRRWCRANALSDAWPVVTEPFTQWVLEDVFPGGRPDWGDVGVELVNDVSLHERAKLRILNAAHSALAYWGLLAGHEYIWQAVDDPILRAATNDLIDREVIPTLVAPAGWNLRTYADHVLTRFGNRALPYKTLKVAGHGSQKLPVRLMPTVRDVIATGQPAYRSAQVLAAWLATMFGPSATEFGVDDPSLFQQPAVARVVGDGRPVNVRRAVELLDHLPGFESHDGVAAIAGRLWHADVRAVLSTDPATNPAAPIHQDTT